jgi:hypothetical protein
MDMFSPETVTFTLTEDTTFTFTYWWNLNSKIHCQNWKELYYNLNNQKIGKLLNIFLFFCWLIFSICCNHFRSSPKEVKV